MENKAREKIQTKKDREKRNGSKSVKTERGKKIEGIGQRIKER